MVGQLCAAASSANPKVPSTNGKRQIDRQAFDMARFPFFVAFADRFIAPVAAVASSCAGSTCASVW
jgi:hypothetical protein